MGLYTIFAVFVHDPKRIKRLGIRARHVADVGGALEATFDLERADAGVDQIAKPRYQVEILQREQGLVAHQHPTGGVDQIIHRPAGLDALAAVGAAAVEIFREPAVAAVADAEGAVHEKLQLTLHGRTYRPDVVQRELPFEHQAAGAQGLIPLGVFYRSDGALGGGVEGHRDVFPAEDALVADDEGVGPGILAGEHHAVHFRELVLGNADIESDENARAELMGVVAQGGDILHRIAGILAGAEERAAYINGIGTAVDGRDADFQISGGG